MFMSALWDTIFEINDRYKAAEVFLIDNHIPALRFGNADNPVVFAAGLGAAQWQSSVLLLRFFDTLLADAVTGKSMAGIAVKKAFKKRSVVVVPTVCPPKMRYEGEPLKMKDMAPFAKYLAYHRSSMLILLGGSAGQVFAPAANERCHLDGETVRKIILACSKLAPAAQSDGIGAKLCTWASETAGIPSFFISPESSEIADIAYTYKALEETFAVSALL